jgi:thiol-disulfide isomerase/thioredoxin
MMTCGQPAKTMGTRRIYLLLGVGRLLAKGLLLVAACGPASADPHTVASLLKPLKLVEYRSDTVSPHFSGNTLDGGQLSMTDLRGKVVVVNFWASWCAECRPEMPVLERLHREFAAQGLTVVGVNAREGKEAVGRYAHVLGLTFPLVLDPNGVIGAGFGVIGLPTTFVVARNGRAVALAVGHREWGSAGARALIHALLAEPAPTLAPR